MMILQNMLREFPNHLNFAINHAQQAFIDLYRRVRALGLCYLLGLKSRIVDPEIYSSRFHVLTVEKEDLKLFALKEFIEMRSYLLFSERKTAEIVRAFENFSLQVQEKLNQFEDHTTLLDAELDLELGEFQKKLLVYFSQPTDELKEELVKKIENALKEVSTLYDLMQLEDKAFLYKEKEVIEVLERLHQKIIKKEQASFLAYKVHQFYSKHQPHQALSSAISSKIKQMIMLA